MATQFKLITKIKGKVVFVTKYGMRYQGTNLEPPETFLSKIGDKEVAKVLREKARAAGVQGLADQA